MALYNTFKFTTKDFKDEESLLEKLFALKNSGTDFTIPVITPKGVLSFTDYIIGNTSLEFYGRLVKEQLVKNSYAFKIIDGSVIEHEVYNLKWMRSNFSKHQDLILDTIKCLADDLNTNHATKFVGISYSNKSYTIDNILPLLHVIKNIDSNVYNYYDHSKAKIWDTALTYNQEIREYLKPMLSSHSKIKDLLKWPRPLAEFGFNGMATILYHHGFLDSYVESYPNKAYTILYESITRNELNDVKKLIPIYQQSILFSPENNYKILKEARTPEMANLLMENGFSIYHDAPHDHPEKNVLFISLCKEMNLETIEAILKFKPLHQEVIEKNHDFIFEEFLKVKKLNTNESIQAFEKIKLLIKHKFPLEEFDMLNVGFNLDKKDTSYSKWFIENGANPTHCDKFVKNLKQDNNFSKLLEKYSQIIDVKSPDFIHEMVKNIRYQSDVVKEYCKTISHEDLLQPTQNGGYAWWGMDTNSTAFTQFIHKNDADFKIKIKNSFVTDKDSWIAQLFLNDNFQQDMVFLQQYKKLFFSSEEKYPIKMQTNNQENILHKLFVENTTSSILNFFIEETDININSLLLEKNKNGQTPLEQLLFESELQKERNLWRRQNEKLAQMAKKIINHLKTDFPFEAMANEKQKAIDVIRDLFSDEEEFESFYRESIKNKIELQLPEKNTHQIKKIKI